MPEWPASKNSAYWSFSVLWDIVEAVGLSPVRGGGESKRESFRSWEKPIGGVCENENKLKL